MHPEDCEGTDLTFGINNQLLTDVDDNITTL